jgi:hypothetical protein
VAQRLLRGEAEIEVVVGPAPEYLQAAAKSMQGEELAAFEATCRETYDRMARISVVPDWARYFKFAAGRFPAFLRADLQGVSASNRPFIPLDRHRGFVSSRASRAFPVAPRVAHSGRG